MDFANAARNNAQHTYTENGAEAYNTTSNALLDFFAVVGALRQAEKSRPERLFADAYAMDPVMATKILFYGRDIREGLGERVTFRKILRYAAAHHPEAVRPNIDLIGVYGRYDDLYCLVGTPLEEDMWKVMKSQFDADYAAMKRGESVSLLGKWVKTADASSDNTRKLGILTAQKLGYSVYEYKRMYKALRKHIGVVETLMSQGRWDEIKYPEVPSRAMSLYRNAFMRHDEAGMTEFMNKVASGEKKIQASTLYPYDLVRKYLGNWYNNYADGEDPVIEEQWKALPNYVDGEKSVVVMADTSGSMWQDNNTPISSALGLGIYFAQRNKGAYHGLVMEFSSEARFHSLRGETLFQQIRNFASDAKWGMSTNLGGAFLEILRTAVNNHVKPEEMPAALLVISDMEIDEASRSRGEYDGWGFYDSMVAEYARFGYRLPNVVFWNVNSRHDVYHVDAKRRGVQLVSGHSVSSFKNVLGALDKTPIELMTDTINCERYAAVTVEGC